MKRATTANAIIAARSILVRGGSTSFMVGSVANRVHFGQNIAYLICRGLTFKLYTSTFQLHRIPLDCQMSAESAINLPTPTVERDLSRDVLRPVEIVITLVLTVGCAVGLVWLVGLSALRLVVPLVFLVIGLYLPCHAVFESIRKVYADSAIHAAARDVQQFPNDPLLHYRLAELYAYRASLWLTAEHIRSAVQEEALKHLAQAFMLGLTDPYDPRKNPNLTVLRENYRFGEVLGVWDTRSIRLARAGGEQSLPRL